MDAEKTENEKRLYDLVAKVALDNPGYRVPAWLLENGQFFTPAPLPAEIERGDMGWCDLNTLFVVIPSQGRYRFAEGFGLAEDKAVRHTWAVTADGVVVDPTWDAPESRAYFGFVVETPVPPAIRKPFTQLEWYVKELADRQ